MRLKDNFSNKNYTLSTKFVYKLINNNLVVNEYFCKLWELTKEFTAPDGCFKDMLLLH